MTVLSAKALQEKVVRATWNCFTGVSSLDSSPAASRRQAAGGAVQIY